jgi:general secretion pathway protein A
LQWLADDRVSDRGIGGSKAGQRERLMENRSVTSSQFQSLLHQPLSLVWQDLSCGKHFGFTKPPFTSDPQFFYSNAANEKILTALAHEIAGKGAVVVVTGEPGTGKTTLLRRLISDSAEKIDYIFIRVTARLSFTGVLREILGETDASSTSTDRECLFKHLDSYLHERRANGRGVALVFDEAQTINDKVLKELLLLCSSKGKGLMSIVLAGQPGLQGRPAQHKSLKQRMTLTKRLTPLKKNDVAPYIALRLNLVGYQGEQLFDQQAIERIVDWSGGIPRLINSICDSALINAYRASEYKVSAKMIDQVAYELRLGGRLPSVEQRPPGQMIQLRNRERTLLGPPVEAKETVAHVEQEENEIHPTSGIAKLTSLGHRAHRFSNVDRRRVRNAALMILVVASWSLVIFYPQQRNGTGLVVSRHENSSPRKADPGYRPAKTTRAKNRGVAKEPPQPAPASTPSHSVAEWNEKQDDLAVAKEQIEEPSVSKAESLASDEIYRVSGASFVRNKPTADAEIIDTLAPGIRVAILSRSGEYLRVRSLGEAKVFGFVHREDAFFERVQ